ncbi:MAG: hypothetical protein IKN73_01460 [Alphaproteobacteria bacterium]|nr:hypothetical protein [Alphaproteobacteria bacterium]
MKKIIFCMFVSFLCLCNAGAATQIKCPAGFFCASNGVYTPYGGGIQSYQKGAAEQVTPSWGDWSEELFCSSCKKSRSGCSYCADDYDEAWVSTWFGFYLIKNGEVTHHTSGNSPARGAFPCPGTYPSSAEGATSVFECYKVVGNGQKEYYKAPVNTQTNYSGSCDIADLQALFENLQSALNNANKLAQDLQNALNKAQSQSLVKSSKLELTKNISEDKKSFQSGKNLRSGSARLNNDIETAKAMIKAGI